MYFTVLGMSSNKMLSFLGCDLQVYGALAAFIVSICGWYKGKHLSCITTHVHSGYCFQLCSSILIKKINVAI